MPKFLVGPELQAAISDVLNDREVRCAVAFWGYGAKEWFGKKLRNAKVICNLNMGGTNPASIRELIKDKARFEVRQCDVLHAKVYIGERSAVVTSANLSANGLGCEGQEVKGWIEAGVWLADVAPLKIWFDHLWDNPTQTRIIQESDLEKAASARKSRELGFTRGRPSYIAVWSEQASDEALDAIGEAKKLYGIQDLDFYENWDEIPEGADIYDFELGSRGGVTFNGMWQTYSPQLKGETSGGSITLCVPKRTNLFREKIAPNPAWRSIIRKLAEKGAVVVRFEDTIFA